MQSDVLGKNNPYYTYTLTGSQFALPFSDETLGSQLIVFWRCQLNAQ